MACPNFQKVFGQDVILDLKFDENRPERPLFWQVLFSSAMCLFPVKMASPIILDCYQLGYHSVVYPCYPLWVYHLCIPPTTLQSCLRTCLEVETSTGLRRPRGSPISRGAGDGFSFFVERECSKSHGFFFEELYLEGLFFCFFNLLCSVWGCLFSHPNMKTTSLQ